MANLTIQLPVFDAEHKIEIHVKVNGKKKRLHYCVELFDWDECEDPTNKASCLKHMINSYDPQWQVVQIGEATDKTIQVMFREKVDSITRESEN
jgi:hypothetical protein